MVVGEGRGKGVGEGRHIRHHPLALLVSNSLPSIYKCGDCLSVCVHFLTIWLGCF